MQINSTPPLTDCGLYISSTNYSPALFFQGAQINEAACDLAREVASEGDALVAGGVSQTPSYLSCKSEVEVKAVFKKQLEVFMKKNVDFLIAEVDTHFVSFC